MHVDTLYLGATCSFCGACAFRSALTSAFDVNSDRIWTVDCSRKLSRSLSSCLLHVSMDALRKCCTSPRNASWLHLCCICDAPEQIKRMWQAAKARAKWERVNGKS